MIARIALVLISLLPLPLGFIINRLLMTIWFYTFPMGWLMLIGLFVLLVWFVMGMVTVKWIGPQREVLLYLNTIPGLFLILVLFQEFVIRRFWTNLFGISTQFYYLPIATLSSRLLRIIPFITTFITIRLSYVYALAFCIMLAASFVGRSVCIKASRFNFTD